MIQRIQTVYLILVTLVLVACMCLPVGFLVQENGNVFEFMNLGIDGYGVTDRSPWGMFAILLLSAIIAVLSIFLFKNRMLQIRMTIFNSVILIGYYIVFIVFTVVMQSRLEATYNLAWGICLPFIALVLNYLAIRAIGKDEVMIKAADRLR